MEIIIQRRFYINLIFLRALNTRYMSKGCLMPQETCSHRACRWPRPWVAGPRPTQGHLGTFTQHQIDTLATYSPPGMLANGRWPLSVSHDSAIPFGPHRNRPGQAVFPPGPTSPGVVIHASIYDSNNLNLFTLYLYSSLEYFFCKCISSKSMIGGGGVV